MEYLPDPREIPRPKWKFKKKNALSAELHKRVFGKWLNEDIDSEVLLVLFEDVCDTLGLKTKSERQAANDTLVQYVGMKNDESLNRLLCMQFSWNLEELNRGKALRKFTSVNEYQWLPFQIGEISHETKFGTQVAKMCLLCFGGFAAGYVTTKSVPWGYLRYFAYQVGFNRRWMYEDNPSTLHNLRFAGLVEPSDVADLRFHRYHMTASMKSHNASFIHKRVRDTREEL